MNGVRAASRSGIFYASDPEELDRDLSKWLDEAGERVGVARAIISPHANYCYSGDTAAYAFKQIVPDNIDRVFVLGPSHYTALDGCALAQFESYNIPFGDIPVDQKVTDELRQSGLFTELSRKDEEYEQSVEIMLPYLFKVMQGRPFTIVPIYVGTISESQQEIYGNLLAEYLEDPSNLFVVSSDFCHWGNRFNYIPLDHQSGVPIHEQVKQLDREAMDAIETLNPSVFVDYIKKTQNTICGRNPITLMLQAASHFHQTNNHNHEFRFLKYSQAIEVHTMDEFTVCYAAGALFVNPK